jgi:hypothetical protein
MEVKMRSSTMILMSAVAGVALLLVVSNRDNAGLTTAAQAAPAAAPVAVSPIRALTSASCASDGCPTTCNAEEALVSAICVGVTGAKFSEAIKVADGVMTATCGSSASSIVVVCARK